MTRSLARCLTAYALFVFASILLLAPAHAQREGGPRRGARDRSGPSCTVVGPDRICGRSTGLTYSVNIQPGPNQTFSWSLHTVTTDGCVGTGTTNPTFCGPTNGPTVCVIPGTAAGRFVLKVEVFDGNTTVTCCLSINVMLATSTSTPPPASVCAGSTHTFCTTPSGGGPYTFQWEKNGVAIPGATDSCYTATAGPAGVIDNYCVTATGSGTCAGAYTACALLTSLPGTTVASLPTPRRCEGVTFQFCPTVSGTPPFTYLWAKNGSPIPGATDSCYTATAGPPGTVDGYCVTVQGACGPAITRCGSLTTNLNPIAADLVGGSVCEGEPFQFCTSPSGQGPFGYSWTKNGSSIPGATDSCYTATAGPGGTIDTYCVTVSGLCGTDESCADLVSTANTSTSTFDEATVCELASETFCVTPGGTGPFTYSWTKNGNPIPGATDSCYTATAGADGTIDNYCATVGGTCGPPSSACFSLTAVAGTSFPTDLPDTSGCDDEQVTLCTTPAGTGPFTYQWTRNGSPVTGATDSCYTFDLASGDSEICVTVTGTCGPPATSCAALSVQGCGGSHITLTQGAYGNSGGQFNGEGRLSLIEEILQGGVTVGVLGTRSLTLQGTTHDAQCVIDRLPTSGRAEALPDFGDEQLDVDCQTSPIGLVLQPSGRFRNILLGQVISLSLNIGLSSGVTSPNGCTTIPSGISGQAICPSMSSRKLLAGPDGCIGTADDVPDVGGPLVNVTIQASVLSSLTNLGLPQTIGGLLELGNRALAGMSTDTATLDEVSSAVDAINILYDEGREIVNCGP